MFGLDSILSGINTGVNAMGGWGDVAKLGMSLYGASKNKKAGKKAAKQAAQMATPIAYGTGSMYGSTTVDPRTRQIQYNMAQSPFAQLLNQGGLQSFANAFAAPGQAYYGAAPEIVSAAQGMFGPGLETEAANRLSILRQLAAPQEQQQTTSLNDRLFSMGRLGGTGGGIEQEALARAQAAADLQRTLASQDWAQNRAQSRFTSALQAVGAGQAQQGQAFGMGQGSMGGIGDLFKMLLAQGQQGIGAATAVPGEIAALNAGARTAPGSWDAFGQWVDKSNVFDAIGGWLGGTPKTGATTTPTGNTGIVGPVPGGYSGVRIPEVPGTASYGY